MSIPPTDDPRAPLLGQASLRTSINTAREDHFYSVTSNKSRRFRPTQTTSWQPPPPRSTQNISRVTYIPDRPQGEYNPLPEDHMV